MSAIAHGEPGKEIYFRSRSFHHMNKAEWLEFVPVAQYYIDNYGKYLKANEYDGLLIAYLLFYHLKMRCFIVIDLKKGDFKPEYAGKMNFYCSAVDDLIKNKKDKPTIGLILCQTKDKVMAEYALRI